MAERMNSGCWVVVYALLSYPINWLCLHFIVHPMWPNEDWSVTGPFLLLFSPVTLPFEMLIILPLDALIRFMKWLPPV